MNNYIGIDVAKATLLIYIPKNDLDIEIEGNNIVITTYDIMKIYLKG